MAANVVLGLESLARRVSVRIHRSRKVRCASPANMMISISVASNASKALVTSALAKKVSCVTARDTLKHS